MVPIRLHIGKRQAGAEEGAVLKDRVEVRKVDILRRAEAFEDGDESSDYPATRMWVAV